MPEALTQDTKASASWVTLRSASASPADRSVLACIHVITCRHYVSCQIYLRRIRSQAHIMGPMLYQSDPEQDPLRLLSTPIDTMTSLILKLVILGSWLACGSVGQEKIGL